MIGIESRDENGKVCFTPVTPEEKAKHIIAQHVENAREWHAYESHESLCMMTQEEIQQVDQHVNRLISWVKETFVTDEQTEGDTP